MSQEAVLEDLRSKLGTEIHVSDWLDMTQERINQFADATDDHQFIHTDPEKAAETPFGGTIAHGYLTLSMIAKLSFLSAFVPEGTTMGVNYGLNKVRFMKPVPVDSEIRAVTKVMSIDEKRPGQYLITNQVTIEIKGEKKPALIAVTLGLYMTE